MGVDWLEIAEDEESRAPEVYSLGKGREQGPMTPAIEQLRQRLGRLATEAAAGVWPAIDPRDAGAAWKACVDLPSLAAHLAESLAPERGTLRIVNHRFHLLDPDVWGHLVERRLAAYHRPGEIHLVESVMIHLERHEQGRELEAGLLTLTEALLARELIRMLLAAEGLGPDTSRPIVVAFEQCCTGDDLRIALDDFFLSHVPQGDRVARERAASPPSGTSCTVLVVDDTSMARHVICTVLDRLGIRTVEAEDGTQALQAVTDERPDLVILDLGLPDISGLVALERMRVAATADELPVIVVTASSESEDVRRAAALGAQGYLIKPVKAERLVDKIRQCIEVEDADS